MASLGFFRTSIHSITDVANDKPYLQSVSTCPNFRELPATHRKSQAPWAFNRPDLPSGDVLRVMVSEVYFRSAANGNTLGLAVV